MIVVSAAIVGIATPAFAQLPVPVPTVQVPVPVPTVQVPVPVPTVRVPVPVPTAQVPVPVPTVQVPDVPVPVPTSAPPSGGGSDGGGSAPPSGSGGGSGSSSSPGGGGSGSGSSSSGGGSGSSSSPGGGSGASSSGGGSGSSSSTSGGGSGPSSPGGGSSSASSGDGSAGSSPAGGASSSAGTDRRGTASASRAGAASTHTRPAKSAAQRCSGRPEGAGRRDCELRATVADTSRCLGDLSTGQRRVLTLRAGIGAGPPRSRGGVAKRLRISERRVARLERTGLRRLRTLGNAGACAPPDTQTFAAADVASGAAGSGTVANPAGTAGSQTAPGEKTTPRNRVSDRSESKIPPIGDVAGESATNPPGSSDLAIPLVLLLIAALAVALVVGLRRGPTPAPADELAPDDRPLAGPSWIPWHRSTMKGPGWNDPRPPTDRPGEWSDQQRRTPAPEPEREPAQLEEWTPPTRRSPTHRR